jgi:hypothetical protein
MSILRLTLPSIVVDKSPTNFEMLALVKIVVTPPVLDIELIEFELMKTLDPSDCGTTSLIYPCGLVRDLLYCIPTSQMTAVPTSGLNEPAVVGRAVIVPEPLAELVPPGCITDRTVT